MADTRIMVYSGRVVDPINPDPATIDIEDIAHALSNQCRFSGHTRIFYSVAEHSVRVSWLLDGADRMYGLMHDASEAYLQDVASPLKLSLFGEAYRKTETGLMDAISARFGLGKFPAAVKDADLTMLVTERRDLLPVMRPEEETDLWAQWLGGIEPVADVISPWAPGIARTAFLNRFYLLTS